MGLCGAAEAAPLQRAARWRRLKASRWLPAQPHRLRKADASLPLVMTIHSVGSSQFLGFSQVWEPPDLGHPATPAG